LALGRRLPVTAASVLLVLALAACGGGGGASKQEASRAPLDPAKTYDVLVETNHGNFTIRLAVKTSPATTASFASLVRKGFFNGTVFHRIVPGFVIQGGDPKGDGTGGPGYTTVDPPPSDAKYTKGVVAMAKTAAEPPGTAGSQFFVVTGADVGLPPDYALLGNVSSGMDVVDKIGTLGDPNDPNGVPTKRVVIEKATIGES
jgi:peptidyl-prolyl cis-trans isomerase B (cyclophilin B)